MTPHADLDVLIVDDDEAIVRTLLIGLKGMGCRTRGAHSPSAALETLRRHPADLVLTDMRMEERTGVDLIREVSMLYPHTVCVIMTAFASYENAVAAIKAGAFDYMPKPFGMDQLQHLVRKVSTLIGLRRENARLRDEAAPDWFSGLTSPASRALEGLIDRIAPTDATMLFTGETGTGKTELARTLHRRSHRAARPFVEVTCTTIAETLFESEVFGHARGAFTGAVKDHAGKFEQANGGTLFLDEVGDLAPAMQSKLLRFLDDRVIERVGGSAGIELDVRVIAATNRDLTQMVAEGTFREDLYYRLNTFECHIPPLRERREDIPPLATRLLHRALVRYPSEHPPVITEEVLHLLMSHDWPGNVRELRNVMERATLLCAGGPITSSHLPPALVAGEGAVATVKDGIPSLREVEEAHIRKVLGMGFSMERAADVLGITTVTLWRKRKEMGTT
ncbi:sigma-54-dependent transcriptional regulator [Nitratidesulfovibrio vulgaris]|uniref:Two component, sigma54 specific, transcriptional regulator, Fis family n=1 Tax=Nitratidesulfovibrio vulgaris (strain DP4) TaxID=391774 RepID=A0A0H3A3H9_NITV4|nr:sigma-54 dependent transcriptional regulator [Nitratidesulfovibrio vulgaris]ABM27082.1 two component, sigma54 specific, transcriptional regulator, Fis family [Nitratidesulfovibrio vulgaris DP4]